MRSQFPTIPKINNDQTHQSMDLAQFSFFLLVFLYMYYKMIGMATQGQQFKKKKKLRLIMPLNIEKKL